MLLAKRAKPPLQWSFPGGKIEAGETPEQAVIREVLEEVSAGIAILGKAGEREMRLAEHRYIISVFAARLVSGEPSAGPEASEIGWFEIGEIEELDTTPELESYALEAKLLFLSA